MTFLITCYIQNGNGVWKVAVIKPIGNIQKGGGSQKPNYMKVYNWLQCD